MGKIGVLIRYAIENEQMKHKRYIIRRQALLHDVRVATQASNQEFSKYYKQNFEMLNDESETPDSAEAANDILSRGIAHGRKRK